MLSAQDIERLLISSGVPVSGSAVRDIDEAGLYYVFVEVRRDARGRQVPTNKALAALKGQLKEKGAFVDFVLTDGTMRNAETGLRATLLHSFGGAIRNAFLSSKAKDAFVWVVPKRQITEPEINDIEAKAKVFLDEVGLKLAQISTTSGENLPSKTRCMTMLRQEAPVTCARLAELLREKRFVVPSDDWMSRRLDALRKAGLVVRMKSGLYALSLKALRGLGTVKGRASPDVSRLLALASKRG